MAPGLTEIDPATADAILVNTRAMEQAFYSVLKEFADYAERNGDHVLADRLRRMQEQHRA